MATMNEKDYYAILGVSKDADKKEIQRAFQQKARKLHPDVNKEPDAEERFKEVSEAYAVLSDDQKRARYDAMRSGGMPFGGSPAQGAYRGGYSSPYGSGFPFDGFPFGGAQGARRGAAYNPEDGADVVVDIGLDASESKAGAKKKVTYRRYATCSHCEGKGSVSSSGAHACPSCGGRGAIDIDLSFLFGAGTFQTVCPECGGSGRVVGDPCIDCGGSGRVAVTSEAVVTFEPGTHDGDLVRIKGMGHAGTNGAAGGDLIGRAHVAAERLEGTARTGFYLFGLALPLALLVLVDSGFVLISGVSIIPLLMGLYMVLTDDVLHRTPLWWKRGVLQIANGAANGLIFACMFLMFRSCDVGLRRAAPPSAGATGGMHA